MFSQENFPDLHMSAEEHDDGEQYGTEYTVSFDASLSTFFAL